MNDKTHSKSHAINAAEFVTENPWQRLNRYTNARIAIGRAGASQTTEKQLALQLAHARAKDAVEKPIAWNEFHQQLSVFQLPIVHLSSQAPNRSTYLQRPDLGRKLDNDSLKRLRHLPPDTDNSPTVCIVIADGLSATAIEHQSIPMLEALLPGLQSHDLKCTSVFTVDQGRVAIGDEVCEILQADILIMMIGERPGLSSPDSLGIYFTYQARTGFSDAQRNCLSNIRPQGLSFKEASKRLLWLVTEAQKRQRSGVHLKDNSQGTDNLQQTKQTSFLLEK